MTRQLDLLTARTVAGLKDPGRYADGGNLYLRVSSTGAKRWTFLSAIGTKKNRELGLGSAGTVTLADAREKATAARKLLVNGIDPKVEKREDEAAREIASVMFGQMPGRTSGSMMQRYICRFCGRSMKQSPMMRICRGGETFWPLLGK